MEHVNPKVKIKTACISACVPDTSYTFLLFYSKQEKWYNLPPLVQHVMTCVHMHMHAVVLRSGTGTTATVSDALSHVGYGLRLM